MIFAEGSFQSPADFRRMAWELEEHEIHMIVVPALTDISAQRLDVRPVAGLPLVDVARPQAIAAARWIKRTWDAAGAAVLLLLASPVMALVALAIKIEDGGPVLFRQTRVGLRGENFQCLKFRSMVLDAEARLAELAAANEGSGPLFKMTQDPRITTVGRFIRRFSLDELPQLWNALRGDMSLVGPRPALPTEVAQYDSDTRRRLDVRPGLTGLWQVSGTLEPLLGRHRPARPLLRRQLVADPGRHDPVPDGEGDRRFLRRLLSRRRGCTRLPYDGPTPLKGPTRGTTRLSRPPARRRSHGRGDDPRLRHALARHLARRQRTGRP